MDGAENPKRLKAPVLFLVFNRLETTRRVFAEIRRARPPRFYVACDGPRENVPGDGDRVGEVRDFILKGIDWPCEVKTLFREKNLGCRNSVSGAITWFFEQEEAGIVLEDDCLPSPSFFGYCDSLLERYRDDERVWHIGGCNFLKGKDVPGASYYFSRYCFIWGWASWRRAWKKYDVNMARFPEFLKNGCISGVWREKEIQDYWMRNFQSTYEGKINSWDFQWVFTLWCQSGLAILPRVNLVSNIGFGADSTHTSSAAEFGNLPTHEMEELSHPPFVVEDYDADLFAFNRLYRLENPIFRGMRKLRRLLFKK